MSGEPIKAGSFQNTRLEIVLDANISHKNTHFSFSDYTQLYDTYTSHNRDDLVCDVNSQRELM